MSSRNNDESIDSLTLGEESGDDVNIDEINYEPNTNNASDTNVQIIDSPIFKVYNLIGEDTVSTVTVFHGYHLPGTIGASTLEELEEMVYTDAANPALAPIFSNRELEMLNSLEKKPIIKFVDASIRLDDSVERIKLKIMTAMGNQYATEEMYLFCASSKEYNPVSVYQQLSQEESFNFNGTHLSQLLSNIHDYTSSKVDLNKPGYTYDDIAKLELQDKTFTVDKQIGQNLFVGDSEYPLIANPYKITASNKLIEQTMKTKISTLNANILLNYDFPKDNAIFLCLAENVVKRLGGQFDDYVIKMYYPSLLDKSVTKISNLTDQIRQQLIEPSIAMTSGKSIDVFNSIDMFYDVYRYSSNFPLKYSKQGIKQIKITLRPDFEKILPLDAIFKLLHSNKTTPLVKQHFSSKRDNVYRMYTDRMTVDGAKVPYLNISSINNITKTLSKVASVSVYIEYMIARTIHSFICSFEETGDISIYAKFEDSYLVSVKDFDEHVKTYVNPVIEIVKSSFVQSGITVNLYDNLFADNVNVVQMTFKCIIRDVVKFDAVKNIGCISSAFNVESPKTNPVTMRFKRVSNFNKSTSLEAFMIEQVNQDLRASEIIESIMQNFNMTDADANNALSSFMSAHQITVGAKKISNRIKINPGFFTSFEYKNRTISVEVEGINNAFYLHTVPIYIDTIVRIMQPDILTNYPVQKIMEICSGASREGVGDVVVGTRDIEVEG